MKIAVLVKQVPSGDSPLRIADDSLWVKEENVSFITNESDSYAVEEALQLREKSGDGEVVAVSLGPETRFQLANNFALLNHSEKFEKALKVETREKITT